MKRRIFLMLGTFLVVLLAFVIYKMWTGGALNTQDKPPIAPVVQRPATTSPTSQGAGEELYLVQRDSQGRLEAVYQAKTLQRFPDGSIALQEPHFTMFNKNGSQLHVQAKKGLVYADQVAKKLRVRRGRLTDDVRLVLDRDTSADRTDMYDRPDDLLQVFLDDIEFDNDLLEINSNSPVRVQAAEADITGQGLQVRFNQQPTDLRELRILQGKEMIVRNVPQEIDMMSLPGTGGGATSQPEGPTSRPVVAKIEPAVISTTAKVTPIEHLVAGAASEPQTRPASQPAKLLNVYLAEFNDDAGEVKVVHGTQTLSGAKKLSLMFDLRKNENQPASGKTAGKTAVKAGGKTGVAAATSKIATTRPDQPMLITWSGPLVVRPVDYTAAPSNKRFTIKADGDNVTLKDSQATAICRQFEYHSVPSGKADQSALQTGILKGTQARPASLDMTGGDHLECESMAFDRQGGIAHLVGQGKMIRRSQGMLGGTDLAAGTPTSAPVGEPAIREEITWSKAVDANFTEVPTLQKDGTTKNKPFIKDARFFGNVHLQSPAAGGKASNSLDCDELYTLMAATPQGGQYPSRAEASGNVKAAQDSSNIMADRLVITTKLVNEPGPDGKMKQRPVDDVVEAFGTPVRPVVVTDLRDPTKPPVVATCDYLTSQSVRDIVTRKPYRKATLKGKPAHVSQGPDSIEGPEIQMDEQGEMATVIGAGRLMYLSKKDMEGRDLANPRTVRVNWTSKMDYRGAENRAIFTGAVKLRSLDESLDAESMTLAFEEKPAEVGASERLAGPPAPKATTRPADSARLALGMEKFSSRKPKTITATKNVELMAVQRRLESGADIRSTYMYAQTCPLARCFGADRLPRGKQRPAVEKSADEASVVIDRYFYLTQRMWMTAKDSLVFDVATKTVDVIGPGTLISEDYTAPDSKKAAADSTSMQAEKPAQSVFAWTKHMQWLQASRQVMMTGEVNMMRYSGLKMVNIKALRSSLNLPLWPATIGGKDSTLTCNQLIAKFAPPVKNAPAGKAGAGMLDSGPNIGPLEQFIAMGLPRAVDETGTVRLSDGPMEINGRQIEYNVDNQTGQTVIDIFGYLNGETPAKATFAVADPARPQSASFPSMRVVMRNGQVMKIQPTEGLSGHITGGPVGGAGIRGMGK